MQENIKGSTMVLSRFESAPLASYSRFVQIAPAAGLVSIDVAFSPNCGCVRWPGLTSAGHGCSLAPIEGPYLRITRPAAVEHAPDGARAAQGRIQGH